MARKKKSSKKQSTKRKKQRSGGFSTENLIPPKAVVIVLLVIALAAGIIYALGYYFLNSQAFEVKEIVVNKDRTYSFASGEQKLEGLYIGRNIFTVDLEQVQALINSDYPQLRKIEVRRNLPDVLEVDIVSRDPVAVIDTAGGVVIDREGVVLNIGNPAESLVKIKGIKFFINRPSTGEKIDNKALDKALILLEGFRKKIPSDKRSIEYINISDKNNIVVGIHGVTVKMGSDDFLRKIGELRAILNDPDINMSDINYIDLRFDNAVISPK